MKTEIIKEKFKNHRSNSGCFYGLGVIGAATYFISSTTGFWLGVLGFLKAIVWPAFMVYEVFTQLGV